MGNGLAPDGHFIHLGFLAAWRVDDKINLSVFDPVHNVRSPFSNFEDRLDRNPIVDEDLSSPPRRNDLESQVDQLLGNEDDRPLVFVHDADKNPSLERHLETRRDLRLGKGEAKIGIDPHHLTC